MDERKRKPAKHVEIKKSSKLLWVVMNKNNRLSLELPSLKPQNWTKNFMLMVGKFYIHVFLIKKKKIWKKRWSKYLIQNYPEERYLSFDDVLCKSKSKKKTTVTCVFIFMLCHTTSSLHFFTLFLCQKWCLWKRLLSWEKGIFKLNVHTNLHGFKFSA